MAPLEKNFDPWTQAMHVHWPVSFAFLERRFTILRRLEELESLSAYRIDEGEIGARFRGNSIRLDVDRISLTLAAVTDSWDNDLSKRILEIVLDEVEPRELRSVLVLYQHMIPISGTPEDNQASFAGQLLGQMTHPFQPSDFTVESEGNFEDAKVSLIVGIVSAEEAVDRLASRAWTVAAKDAQDKHMVSFWKKRELPKTAIYVNSDWFWGGLAQADNQVSFLTSLWTKEIGRSSEIAQSVDVYLRASPGPELSGGDEG